ncbi:MAG: hypothetical protein M3137_04940, partial [Actinomycetota bacterium]|nr:hypothetical protein [Actinomycetota bacterium]
MATDHPRRGPLPTPVELGARVVTAGLAAAMGGIHLSLWSTGYRHIHIIGLLFLLNGIGSILLAVGLLATPSRLLAPTAALTVVFTVGTLAGLVLSLTTGVFGFEESTGVPLLTHTVWVESAGIITTAIVAAAYAPATLTWLRHRQPQCVRVGDMR